MSKLIRENIWALVVLLIALPVLFLPFSPIVSFIFAFSMLVLFSSYNQQVLRVIFSLVGFFSLTVIYASRAYKEELAMDLSIYYDTYNLIYRGYFFEALFLFGKGVEGGLIVLYRLYIAIFDKLTPFDLAFFNMNLCGIGCISWLEIYGLKYVEKKYRGICMAFFLLFFSVQMSGFLQRQALATIILLFAISQKKSRNFYLLTLLATFFHITSLVLCVLFRYVLRKDFHTNSFLKVFIIVLLFRVSFPYIVQQLIGLGSIIPGMEKLYQFSEISFSIASARYAILVILLLIINVFFYKKINSYWKKFIIVSCVFYLIFLGIPLFSERIFFILLYLYGYFLFISMKELSLKVAVLFSFVYLSLFVVEKLNGLQTLYDPFWQRYPVSSIVPFYYFNPKLL